MPDITGSSFRLGVSVGLSSARQVARQSAANPERDRMDQEPKTPGPRHLLRLCSRNPSRQGSPRRRPRVDAIREHGHAALAQRDVTGLQ